jgi:hypothetical protein
MSGEGGTVAHQRATQHGAAVDDIVTLLNRIERLVEVGEWNFSEKPEGAQVDAENQRAGAGNRARGRKQCAVSS